MRTGAGSTRRAGRAVRRRTRRDQLGEIRQVWWRLLLLLAVWISVTVGLAWIQRSDFARGFVVGVMAMGFVLVVYAFLAAGRTVHFGMGAEAEQWTTRTLRKLGRPWLVLDDVSFADANVDRSRRPESRLRVRDQVHERRRRPSTRRGWATSVHGRSAYREPAPKRGSGARGRAGRRDLGTWSTPSR